MLSIWSLRRVLLAGLPGSMLRAMESQLCAIGARPLRASIPLCEESLSSALHEGRYTCIIVPDLLALLKDNAQTRVAALNTLLGEAREAGVPLSILLCPSSAPDAAPLISHAQGWARGAFGDPVNVQCILYTGENTEAICREALMLGARFLAGEQACTGVFAVSDTEKTLGLSP